MSSPDQVRALIRKAVEIAGSQAKLGAGAGVKQASIWQAIEAGRISAELALGIDRATDGKVSASELRPDLWASPEHVPPAPCGAAPADGAACLSPALSPSASLEPVSS